MPVQKIVIAVSERGCRVDTRCRNHPVTGITAAIVSMNAVESHWAAWAVMPRSVISRGIALIMIVSLRITMNVASTSQRTTGGVRPGAAARPGARVVGWSAGVLAAG